MTKNTSSALRSYEKILAGARKKLNIHTPFSLKAGDRWYFDVAADRSAFTLTCPPFSRDTESSFLHYLCHAHILDAGWLLPITETAPLPEKSYFYTVNRSIDHFFDYYAWLLVIEKFGAKYPLRVSRQVASATPELIIDNLRMIREHFASPYPAYMTALDWFSLFPILAACIDKTREAQLRALLAGVAQRPELPRIALRAVFEKIRAVQEFFAALLHEFPRYDALLNDSAVFRRYYHAYYRIVWVETGLNSHISGFY